MLYTTYFANLPTLALDITPVSICGKCPDGYKGLQYKKLAPKWEFFQQWKRCGDNHYYVRCFNEQVLDKLNADKVYEELVELAKNTDIALVCYENRRISAIVIWLRTGSGKMDIKSESGRKHGIWRL